MKKILIGLPPELIVAIDNESHRMGISRSEWLRNTIRSVLSLVAESPKKPLVTERQKLNPYREVRRV